MAAVGVGSLLVVSLLAGPGGAGEVPARPTSMSVTRQPSLSPTAPAQSVAGIAATSAPAPTSTTVPAPTPTTATAAGTMLQDVVKQEAALRSGQLEASLDFGSGPGSSAKVLFDLGDDSHPPRFRIVSAYQGANGLVTVERITVGGRVWERQANGPWTPRPPQESVPAQLQAFLPHAVLGVDADARREGDVDVVRWYDPVRDVDVALDVDPVNATPRRLRQIGRATRSVLVVTYAGWNVPVDIPPPA